MNYNFNMSEQPTAKFLKRVIFKTVEHHDTNNLQNCKKLAIKYVFHGKININVFIWLLVNKNEQ